jgi:ketosteroid isomerase-like protein
MSPLSQANESQSLKAEEIIALERAALDVWRLGDPSGFLELLGPEVTCFDPYQEARIDGFEAMQALYGSLAGTFTIPRYEVVNPIVQLSGDTAVLTFNLVNYGDAGDIASRWNSTEVYRQIGGKWKIVHSHWSNTTPE